MIAGKSILIFERPGNDAGEFVIHFIKSKTIAGTPKNIFVKDKYYIYLFSNQFPGNNLQNAVNNLQFAGNKLQFYGKSLQPE